MRPSDRERQLRRLVAKLSMALPEDVDAVLDQLDPQQQAALRALLADLSGEPIDQAVSSAGRAERQIAIPSGISPWLSARLEDRAHRFEADAAGDAELVARAPADFAMTDTAREALRSVAGGLARTRRSPSSRGSGGSHLLDRLRTARVARLAET
jgi:hypothetical protein